MRLFIAFDIDPAHIPYLVSLQLNFSQFGVFNFTHSFHLTLKFLGEVPDSQLNLITSALKKVNFNKFNVEFSELGVFSPSFVRVVWVGMSPESVISRLSSDINKSLAPLGFKLDSNFSSHITLARVKSIKDTSLLFNFLNSVKLESFSFEVSEFKLYSSILTPQGPQYSLIEKFLASVDHIS